MHWSNCQKCLVLSKCRRKSYSYIEIFSFLQNLLEKVPFFDTKFCLRDLLFGIFSHQFNSLPDFCFKNKYCDVKLRIFRRLMRVVEDNELKRRLEEFGVLTAGWVNPVICIQMTLTGINWCPADRLTDQLLFLLRFSCGVSPHQGSFGAGADPSRASPPAVQPAEAGPPSGPVCSGKARPPHQVRHAVPSLPSLTGSWSRIYEERTVEQGRPPGGGLH